MSCSEVCAGVPRWLRSWVVLSVPGMIFSILFTLPNYFQLSTVLRRDEVSLLDQDSQLYQVTSRDSNEGYPKIRNHGEGPY